MEKRQREAGKEKKKGRHSDAHVADDVGISKALNTFGGGPSTHIERAGQYVEDGWGKQPDNIRAGKVGFGQNKRAKSRE